MYGVQALNNSSNAPFYEELADVSGGHYLNMKHFDIITDMFLAGKTVIEWPTDVVIEWPTDVVIEWPTDVVIEWMTDVLTE